MSKPNLKNVLALTAAAVAGLASVVHADTPITSFTPGDVVVLRGGDTTNPNLGTTTSQVSLYLDEYTEAGGYVGTVAVPSTGPNALTLPGIGDFQHDGVLSLSGDGTLVSFAGYNLAAGSPDAFAAGGTAEPVVGFVGPNAGSLNTSTPVMAYNGTSASPYIRGAFTDDGKEFWTFGKYAANGATSDGGLSYVNGAGSTATTTTVEGFADWRDIIGVNGQLYGGTGSSSVGNHGPYIIDNSYNGLNGGVRTLPTANLGNSTATNTQLGAYPTAAAPSSSAASASGLALLALPGDPNSQNGLNVLYTVGDAGTPGIIKYYYNGTTWVADGLNVGLNAADNVVNPTGLIAVQDPTNPNWVDLTVSGTNGIYTFVDESGYNGNIPSAGGYANFTPTAAPTDEAFYGIALVPTAAVPEPASIGLVGLVAAGLIARRRRTM